MINISENISLSKFTSIKLGGKAKFFCECKTEKDLIECLDYAKTNNLKIQILGGGSNTIFSDEGFDGLVIKIELKDISIHNDFKDNIIIKASAGEEWDNFVKYCIENKFTGVECLSGIPGSVGASPIQNVGAYGQEVKDTIIFVKAIDRETYKPTMFANEDCLFGYRTSRFKTIDKEKYIVTEVLFKLRKDGKPEIKYPELEKYLISKNNVNFSLEDVRNAIIELRKKKAMVIDENEPDSVSCGSFFVNPVLPEKDFENMSIKIGMDKSDIPHYIIEGSVKLSAAWLIEKSGFKKGYTKNGVGISSKHSLALVNKGGTAKDLLNLAEEVQTKVFDKYGIVLIKEPVIVS
jgi:UDP-N-acetylmuramate dehydrogenase